MTRKPNQPDFTASSPMAGTIIGLGALLILSVSTVALTFTGHYALALLPAAALLGLFAFGHRPHWIFLLIVGLIPFWGIRQIAGVNLQWPLGLLLLIILLLYHLPRKRLPEHIPSSFLALFIGLLGVFSLSALNSSFPEVAWENVRWMAASLAFIAFGFVLIDRDMYLHSLPKVLLLTITLGSLAAVLDFVLDFPFIPPRGAGFALTSHPNNLAQMAIFAIPLAVHELVYQTNFRSRLFTIFLLAMNVAAVAISFSRGGFLTAIVIGVILAYERLENFRVRRTGVILLTALIAVTVVAVITPKAYWERQYSLIEWQDRALHRRTAYIAIAWDSFLSAPLLGTGPGTFSEIYAYSQRAQEFRSERESQQRRHAHNGYLELLVGTGIFGLLLFLAILLMAFMKFSAAKRRFRRLGNRELSSLTGAYRTSLIALIMYLGIGSVVYHKFLLFSLALAHAAWWLSTVENETDEEHASPEVTRSTGK
jgi:putative inorganic carbon (HCO3(-)) transporter